MSIGRDSALVRKEKLIEQVKMLGQEVIDRAEDIVGENDFRYSLEVRLIFSHEELPEIECTSTYMSKKYIELLNSEILGKADNAAYKAEGVIS